jgi:16S rRNA processing protein RimM
VVLMAAPLTDPSELWVHELIGSSVFDVGGMSHGRVVSVIANPASDLLELEGGELVPARFVTRFAAGRVDVDVPEGLFS